MSQMLLRAAISSVEVMSDPAKQDIRGFVQMRACVKWRENKGKGAETGEYRQRFREECYNGSEQ